MHCSLHWILEKLRQEYRVDVYGDCEQSISGLRSLRQAGKAREAEMLYLCTASELPQDGPNAPPGIVLCICDAVFYAARPEVAGTALILVRDADVSGVTARLCELLYESGAASSVTAEISAKLLSCRTLEALMQTAYGYLENPFVLFDPSGAVLTSAGQNERLGDTSGFGSTVEYLETLSIPNIHSSELLRQSGEQNMCVLDKSPDPGFPDKLWRRLGSGSASLGSMVLVGFFRPLRPDDAAVFDVLAAFTILLLRQHGAGEAGFTPSDCLRRLLESGPAHPRVREWLRREDAAPADMALTIVTLRPSAFIKSVSMELVMDSLRALAPGALLVRLDAGAVLLEKQPRQWLTDRPEFQELLERDDLSAGVSRIFQAMSRCPVALRQAKLAATLGDRLHPEQRCSLFQKYALYAAMDQLSPEFDLTELLCPGFTELVAQDRENGNGWLGTLRAYLSCGCNKARTAEKTFLHISTLKYRLSQISQRLGLSLDDPETSFQLDLSIRVLDYLDHR